MAARVTEGGKPRLAMMVEGTLVSLRSFHDDTPRVFTPCTACE